MTDHSNPTPSDPQSVAGSWIRNQALEEAALEALSFLEEVPPEKWPPHGLCAERNRGDSGTSAKAARNIGEAIRKLKSLTVTESVVPLDGGARQAFEKFAKEDGFLMFERDSEDPECYVDPLLDALWAGCQFGIDYAFGKAAAMAENTSQLPKLAARLRQMQGKP